MAPPRRDWADPSRDRKGAEISSIPEGIRPIRSSVFLRENLNDHQGDIVFLRACPAKSRERFGNG